jgi:hypothetical protein
MGKDRFNLSDGVALDHIIGQEPFGQGGALFGGKGSPDNIARSGGGAFDSFHAEQMGAADDLLGDWIGHAGAQSDLDDKRAGGRLGGLIAPSAGLDDRIGEQVGAQFFAFGGS